MKISYDYIPTSNDAFLKCLDSVDAETLKILIIEKISYGIITKIQREFFNTIIDDNVEIIIRRFKNEQTNI